jgi:hypothetical protein
MGAQAHPSAQQFAPYVKALGGGGMSEDECILHDGRPIYSIKDPFWRSAAVREMLHTLDVCNLSTHFDVKGNALSGQFPRLRVRGKVDMEASPVTGLPENFYNPDWLARQDEFTRTKLDVRPAREIQLPNDLLQ